MYIRIKINDIAQVWPGGSAGFVTLYTGVPEEHQGKAGSLLLWSSTSSSFRACKHAPA